VEIYSFSRVGDSRWRVAIGWTFFAAYVLLTYDLADALQAGIRILFLRSFLSSRSQSTFWFFPWRARSWKIEPINRLCFGGVGCNSGGVHQSLAAPDRQWNWADGHGRGYNTSSAVREYSLRISNILDLEVLATAALNTLHKNLNVHKGYLFLVDEVNEEGRIYYSLRVVKTADETEAQKEESQMEQNEPLEQKELPSEEQGSGLQPAEVDTRVNLSMAGWVPKAQ